MGRQRKPTYAEMLRKRAGDVFVGREAQRELFRRNFEQEIAQYPIFWIHGQAGIGKSFLVERFQEIAHEHRAATALTNEVESDPICDRSIVNAMARLTRELRGAEAALPAFDKRYEKYRECMQEIEADPDAPTGAFELLGRTTARLAVGAMKATPAGQVVAGLAGSAMEEGLVDQAGQWVGYLARKFKNKDEVALIKDPVGALTPLFVDGLNDLADGRTVVLCFDTWERTGEHLGEWLRALVTREGLSAGVWLVVAGRHAPGEDWEPFFRVMACSELEVFTEEETREYLKRQEIEEEGRIRQILDFSQGVPVLVSMLASAKGGSATDAASDLVERYLKWVDSGEKKEAVLACAAARWFDMDVVAQVMLPHKGVDVRATFNWLTDMPFVQSRPRRWEYHPTVRKLMLGYVRRRSRSESRAAHERLRRYHTDRMMERGEGERYGDGEWRQHRVEVVYQRLMEVGDNAVTEGLEVFASALIEHLLFAREIAATWTQAAEEQPDQDQVVRWADVLTQWAAPGSDLWSRVVRMAEALQGHPGLTTEARSKAFTICGRARYEMGDAQGAVVDYDRAIALGATDFSVYFYRGSARRANNDFQGAMADFNRAIELEPENATLYYVRGTAQRQLGNLQAAVDDCTHAIALDPEYARAYFYRGWTWVYLGDLQQAVADFNQAIELDREFALAYQFRGFARSDMGDLHGAVADIDRAIDLGLDYTGLRARRDVLRRQIDSRVEATTSQR